MSKKKDTSPKIHQDPKIKGEIQINNIELTEKQKQLLDTLRNKNTRLVLTSVNLALNQYGLDWRWLLGRDSSPWYPSARLFRQPTMGDWQPVTERVHKFLSLFKI